MRASRLLSIRLLLQTRGRMTARALADELEVSIRTVYRDVDALSAAGVPVYGDRGPDGGYQLLDGYRTRLTGLTADGAEALFMAGMPGPGAELGLGTVLAAALPPELQSRAGRSRERFHLDAPGWFRETELPSYLAAVADAVWNQRPLRVRYQAWGGEVERAIEPLGLVLNAGVWYAVAQVSGQIRTYYVGRILDLETLEGRFERPNGFDLVAYWQEWSEDFMTRLYRNEAVVRLSPRGLELLPYLFYAHQARRALASARPPEVDGWTRLRLPLESLRYAPVELLKPSADLEVVSPPQLGAQMAEIVAARASMYQSPSVNGT